MHGFARLWLPPWLTRTVWTCQTGHCSLWNHGRGITPFAIESPSRHTGPGGIGTGLVSPGSRKSLPAPTLEMGVSQNDGRVFGYEMEICSHETGSPTGTATRGTSSRW